MSDYDYAYQLNDDGTYALFYGDEFIKGPLTEIALCFDKETGTLFKHGNPDMVSQWYQQSLQFRQKMEDLGRSSHPIAILNEQMTSDLVCIQGKFPLEDLNACLSTTGYVKTFYERLLVQHADQQSQAQRFRPVA